MHDPTDSPLILGFVADLYFSVRIEAAAEKLDYRVRWIERAGQVAPEDPQAPRRQLAEHLVGPGAALIDQVTQWKPALIIFDLSNTAIPWREWIMLLTSVPATRRIPVICFGSHVDVGTLQAAREAGATAVLARSRFFGELPELIQKYARVPDREAIEAACHQPLSPEALRGLEEFNRGEYFEAHESLETAWMAEESAGRELYRAVLQVAVAYYQIVRGNYNGAAKMFLRMRQWIDPLPDTCRGVDVARLRAEAQEAHQALLALGPEGLAAFDRSLLRPVRYERDFGQFDSLEGNHR
jgi:predicted metal-dependent hydrolase